MLLCGLFFKRIYPNYIARIDIFMDNTATEIINAALYDTLAEEYQFERILYDADGRAVSIETDSGELNLFKAKYTEMLYKAIKQRETGYIFIPLGSLLSREIFSGMGPRIKIKTEINGTVKADFKESFTSCGINQVKQKIFLDATICFTAVSATMYRSKSVNTTVPVTETVISGVVPNWYGAGSTAIYGSDE